MNVITSCPRCGADVPTTERDLAEGNDFLCDDCAASLPGMYELVMAERRSLDADPDWAEVYAPHEYETEFDTTDPYSLILITTQGDERWKFRADDIDTLLLELELLLIRAREGMPLDRESVEAAFDHIKSLRRPRVSAA